MFMNYPPKNYIILGTTSKREQTIGSMDALGLVAMSLGKDPHIVQLKMLLMSKTAGYTISVGNINSDEVLTASKSAFDEVICRIFLWNRTEC